MPPAGPTRGEVDLAPLAPSKTVMLSIGKTARKACLENNVIMENEVINVAVSHKHLGLTISTDLRWTAHIESISAKANRRAGQVSSSSRHRKTVL